ncbi:S-adenosyl-L-methionine-dependent methyltransferase [Aspergillus indologenus CBS 114.80]|uniref:S-adenosyl-L-methionine-dependent methyltransferase n=1 Tax=Aspergillus indologenus CBS 114.80 TaxID=1450541 RepID=A0A2V5I5P1_9EURO|nr:S-adenosyl-L-methionine-dependent methyltransferase [Aspergillus indologenus CBS 114.80]
MDKAEVKGLADKVQQAVASYDPSDPFSWISIQDAIEGLRRATEPPHVFLMKQRFHTVQNICLVAAVEMGLLRLLSARAGQSMTASDLARASGYDQALIARIMRMMTAMGLATETGYQSYRANARTIYQSDPGSIGGLVIASSMLYPLASQLNQYLHQHKPCATDESPAPYTFAMRETLWETLSTDPVWKQAFDNNMTTRNKSFSVPWHSKYPVRERLPLLSLTKLEQSLKPFTIVDIGGSQGVDLQRFATTFPDVPCELILQDLRETVNMIPFGLDPRIRPMVYDFFTPQPVKGADIYYLKSILHDWNDEAAREILSNTAQVMGLHSRLLINEMVLAETGETLARADMDMLMWEAAVGGVTGPCRAPLANCGGMARGRSRSTMRH